MRFASESAITCILLLFFAGTCLADDFTFRNTKWGMSVAEVKASEPLTVAKEDETLVAYKASIIGKDVFVVYLFTDNQLTRAKYVLAESHSNRNDFIKDYNDFKNILEKKYGSPSKDETLWRNDLYRNDYSDWGTAISLGHLLYFSTWETENTEIASILTGENFDISCVIEYSSKSLEELEKKAKEKKALDAF